jgi:hypothetical protein
MSLLRPEDTAAVAAPPFFKVWLRSPKVCFLLPLGAAISVGVGSYLIHALFIKLRTTLVVRAFGHARNVRDRLRVGPAITIARKQQ